MYIIVNGNTYQNAVRVKSAQWVEYAADGLAGVVAAGVVTRYRDDGFEIGADTVSDYLRQEATAEGFRLTNIPVPQPTPEPQVLTNKEKSEQEKKAAREKKPPENTKNQAPAGADATT